MPQRTFWEELKTYWSWVLEGDVAGSNANWTTPLVWFAYKRGWIQKRDLWILVAYLAEFFLFIFATTASTVLVSGTPLIVGVGAMLATITAFEYFVWRESWLLFLSMLFIWILTAVLFVIIVIQLY